MFSMIDNNNKLIQILLSFTKKERKRFNEFLHSPYFNKHNDVRLLYKILSNRNDLSKSISKERVIRKLFPKVYKSSKDPIREQDYPRLRNLMNKLLKQAETFILQVGREKNTLANYRIMIDELMLRKLYDFSRSSLKKGFKELNVQSFHTPKYYYDKYRLEEAQLYLDILHKNRSIKNNIQHVLASLQDYSFANILRYYCAAVNQELLLNVHYDFSFLNSFERFLGEISAQMPPLIRIYYHILLFLKEENSDYNFNEVKKLIESEKDSFNSTEIRQMYNFMINFCSFQILKGNLKYQNELHHIYTFNLTTGIWSAGLYFSPHHFYLFVNNALNIKRYHEVEQFIEQYKEQLHPQFQTDMENLSYARLYFAKEDYKNSEKHLRKFLSKEDFFYKIYNKVLWIKLFYEIDNSEKMENALEALRVYLNPKRNIGLGDTFRKAYFEFRRLAYHLWKCRYEPNSKDKIEQLIKDIDESSGLVEREWLRKKCIPLMNKR